MPKRSWSLEAEIRDLHEVLSRPVYREAAAADRKLLSDFLDGRLKLRKGQKGPSREQAPGFIGCCLSMLGPRVGAEGLAQVLNGEPTGWPTVHLAWRMYSWSVRIGTVPGQQWWRCPNLSDHTLALAGALAFGEHESAEGLYHSLREQIVSGAYAAEWPLHPFFSFVLGLAETRFGVERQFQPGDCDDYAEVLQAVRRPDTRALPALVMRLCDLHVSDLMRDRMPNPLRQRPFDLFPAEIFAVIRLVTGEVSLPAEARHPLLASALANVPAQIERLTEPLFDAAIAFVTERHPELQHPWSEPAGRGYVSGPPAEADRSSTPASDDPFLLALQLLEAPAEPYAEGLRASGVEEREAALLQALGINRRVGALDWRHDLPTMVDTLDEVVRSSGIRFRVGPEERLTLEHDGQTWGWDQATGDRISLAEAAGLIGAANEMLPSGISLYLLGDSAGTEADTLYALPLDPPTEARLRDLLGPSFDAIFFKPAPLGAFVDQRGQKTITVAPVLGCGLEQPSGG